MANAKENHAHDDEAQSPPEYWSVKLRELRQELETYKGAQALDEAGQHTKDDSAKRIGELYKELAEGHPDPDVKKQMATDAEQWEKADEEKRDDLAHPLLDGLALLISAPIFVAGVVLYGAGQVLIGLGDLLTFGVLRRRLE